MLPAQGTTAEERMARWGVRSKRQEFIDNFSAYFYEHLQTTAGDMSGMGYKDKLKLSQEVEAEINELAPEGWFDAAFPGTSGSFLKESDKSDFCSAMNMFVQTVKDRLRRGEQRDGEVQEKEMILHPACV